MSGRRNELARARRRTRLKEALSLTSVPKSEEDAPGAAATPRYTLDNHFGWVVLQKSQIGDGTFPHLFQYYEKPDLHGRDFDKVTYVLYMDKGIVVDKNSALKGAETALSGILITEKPSTPGDYYDKTRVEQQYVRELPPVRSQVPLTPEEKIMYTPERKKKKKLISEFYFVKRDRSRSAGDRYKGGYSDADNEWQNPTPDVSKTQLLQIENKVSEFEKKATIEKDRALVGWKEVKSKREDAIKTINSEINNVYHMRAGAEQIERKYKGLKEKYGKDSPVVKKKSSKIMDYAKSKIDKFEISEELLKTSSGTNRYLFVSGKRLR